jgi:outer membrane protein insertion porin family
VLWQAYEVDEVRLEGDLGLDRSDLSRALAQASAQPLSESRVLRGFNQLTELYRGEGYLQAEVRVAVELDEARKRAVVVYRITSGPRTQVAQLDFEGDLGSFTPTQLQDPLRVKPGEPYRKEGVRVDAERLRRWLIRQDHRLARVDPAMESYDQASDTMRLVYPVQVGPKLELEVVGADRKQLEKRGLLPFLGNEGYDEALVLQAKAKIKDDYQRQGFYYVQTETREERRDGVLHLTLTVDPGRQLTIESIDFTGNTAYDDRTLSELMATSERKLLALGSGRLVQSELDDDLDNVRSFYAVNGYTEVEVGPAQMLAEGDRLRVVVPVVEGPRRVVSRLAFEVEGEESGQALSPDQLRADLPLAEGGPFHPYLLDRTVEALRMRYAEKGYSLAQVSVHAEGELAVAVTVDILPGPLVVVDRVIVRGARRTKDEVIERTVDLEPGEPIGEERSRELDIQRRLYQLGIFSRVDVDVARAGLDVALRDVLIRVEEGLPHTLLYGLGYDTEDGARGFVGYTHNNVAGRAYTFRSDVRLSERDWRVRLLFDQPYLTRRPVALSTLLLAESRDEPNRPYEVDRFVARTEAVRVYGNRRVSLGLEHRRVEQRVEPGTASNEIERSDFPYQLNSLIPIFLWDRRDDPLTTTRGWSTLAQLQYAFPALGTDAEFLKLFVQQTQFVPLGKAGVLAASLRFGGIEPYADLAQSDPYVPDALPSSNVPIDERLFAGGDSSHRAYERDLLGILGQSLFFPGGQTTEEPVPAGGDGLFLVNLEYRFPLFGSFGGAVFYDLGNVWADWRDIDPDGFKGGAGLGLRYLSPIGPLRLDVGWKLDREVYESSDPVFFLSFGNPF